MKLKNCESSCLKGYGYENGTLNVVFNSGTTYRYDNVPQSIYEGLENADSKGKYFMSNIRNLYKGVRLNG